MMRLRGEPECAGVPVIVVGFDQDLDAIERARAAGAADHILVPIDQRDFHIRARAQLRRAAALAEPVGDPASAEDAALDADRRSPEGSRRAYETLLRLIDVIPRMLCVTGRDGRYLLVNRMYASFVGLAASRLIGKRPVEAHGGPLARILMESDEKLLSGRAVP